MSPRGAIGTLAVIVLGLASHASAQVPAPAPAAQVPDPHAAMPERPSVATHAGTVAPGWVEIEAGMEDDRYSDAARGGSIPVAYKVGLARRLQLSMQTPLVRPAGETTGLGDASMGVKWRLIDHAPVVGDLAILPSIKFPTGSPSAGTGTGTTDTSLLFISSQQLDQVSMDLNLGFIHRGGDGSRVPRSSMLWAVSFGGPARGPVGWDAELFGFPATSGPAGTNALVAVLLGPTLEVRHCLVFDAGVIAPLTGPQPRAVYAGVTYNIGALKR